MLVAEAFNSEVEILFVEDRQRLDFAGFSFATEYSPRGGGPRRVSARAVSAEMRATFAVTRRRVAAVAAAHDVKVYEHSVRDDPVQALVSACARRGPWNVIAIAEALTSPSATFLDEVFDAVSDATGVIVTGPSARVPPAPIQKPKLPERVPAGTPPPAPARSPSHRSSQVSAAAARPVVLAIEDTDHLHGMLRAGRRIAAALETEIVIVVIAETENALAWMEAEIRLALADEPGVRLALSPPTYGQQAAIVEIIRRLDSGFLIAQFGRATVPRGKSLRPLTAALGCPILLVR